MSYRAGPCGGRLRGVARTLATRLPRPLQVQVACVYPQCVYVGGLPEGFASQVWVGGGAGAASVPQRPLWLLAVWGRAGICRLIIQARARWAWNSRSSLLDACGERGGRKALAVCLQQRAAAAECSCTGCTHMPGSCKCIVLFMCVSHTGAHIAPAP